MKRFLRQGWRSYRFLLATVLVLFLAAFLLNRYVVSTTSAAYYASRIQTTLAGKEKEVSRFMQKADKLARLIQGNYTPEELNACTEENTGYSFFISHYNSSGRLQLQFWNSHTIDPPSFTSQRLQRPGLLFLKNGYYYYQFKDLNLDGTTYRLEVLIPLVYKYFVELENLKTEFAGVPHAVDYVRFTPGTGSFPIRAADGTLLFSVNALENGKRLPNWWTFGIMVLAIICLLQLLQLVAIHIIERSGAMWGILFLTGSVVLARSVLYMYPEGLQLRQFDLFDPAVYSAGFLLSSLGDLSINIFLCCWLAIFITRHFNELPSAEKVYRPLRWIVGFLAVGALVAVTFLYAGILQSLVADAKISFNVTNFFSLDLFSFIGFLVLAGMGVSFFLIGQFSMRCVRAYLPLRHLSLYLLTGTIGLCILTFSPERHMIELNMPVLLWLILFILLLDMDTFQALRNTQSVGGILFWLFFFSCSMSAVIVKENGQIESQQRRLFATKLSQQADPSNERILSIALAYLDNDFLAPNFIRFRDPAVNAFLKDSIISNNFSAFLNQYDTRVFTFDGDLNPSPLFNDEPATFETLNTIFTVQGKETSIAGLRYYEQSFDKYAYIFRREVSLTPDGSIQGYFFIIAEPRKYKQDALVPALFKQGREALLPDYAGYYSYGIYAEGELVDHFNEYPFATHLQANDIPKTEFVMRNREGYDELWYRKTRDNIVVIVRKHNALLEAITLFAYLFSTFLLLFIFNWLGAVLFRSRLQWARLRQYFHFSIRNQIHSTIILVSLFSFVVIGIATIFFFTNRYDRSNQDRLSRTMQIMVNQVERKLKDDPTFFDGSSFYRASRNAELEKLVRETSEIHGADINLYDPAGALRITSRPLIYAKGVLGKQMHPQAWYAMHFREAIQFINEEQMGKISYLSIYNPVRNAKGKVVAYLNVPSYSTEKELKQEISNFLVTLINLNAFIFLVAGAIALYITNRITGSFTLIGRKMQQMNLGQTNQEIVWDRNDEIGGLVREYNKMVHKLDESVNILAKTEREGAWRQMARQVAHEIKNPLTPMKLSIQYLQKAIDNNEVDVKKLTTNVANTLVEQIDHLNKIASDFSQFANIGNPKNERFDLHEVMHSMALLHEANEQISFQWIPCPQPLMVLADKTQLNRLLTNLIQNAIEATAAREQRMVRVREECAPGQVVVCVDDNGNGISSQARSRIFTPNFTTKTSGTGLGLAICKGIVENVNGEIWFETREGEGTTFFVKIPLDVPQAV